MDIPTPRKSVPMLPKAFTFTPRIRKRKNVLSIRDSPKLFRQKHNKKARKRGMETERTLSRGLRPIT